MSEATFRELILYGNKSVIIKNTKTFSNVDVSNEIDVNDTLPIDTDLNQIEWFLKLLKGLDVVDTDLDRQKQLYLNLYKSVIDIYFNARKNSVFTKSKQELGTTFSGVELLRDLDFLGLIDVQNLKDTLFQELNDDPCLVINTEASTLIEPLKLQMVKNNFYLTCRAHIIDFSLRNLFISSVFQNKNFYSLDNSLSNYIFDTLMQRIKTTSISYYKSLTVLLYDELQTKLENGIEFTSKITNQKIQFDLLDTPEQQELNALKYIKYLFENQFVYMCDRFDSFYSRQIPNNISLDQAAALFGIPIELPTIQLSPLYDVKSYFISQIPIEVKNVSAITIERNKFYFLVNINNSFDSTPTEIKITLSSVTELGSEYIDFVSSPTIRIDSPSITLEEIPQDIINRLINQITNNNKFLMLFTYCFPLNKILNFCSISNIYMCSKYYEGSNTAFNPSIKTTEITHKIILGNSSDPLCESIDSDLAFGINLEILKLLLLAPIAILKGIEETFDPNIAIAYRIKQAAEGLGAPDISIIPYSAALMIPPPLGPAIPLIPPWGYIYWGISAVETAINWKKNGIGGIDIDPNFDFDFKNPFKSDC